MRLTRVSQKGDFLDNCPPPYGRNLALAGRTIDITYFDLPDTTPWSSRSRDRNLNLFGITVEIH